jgi:hypothetical protein
MRDRGFIVLFGGLCAAVYVLFAFTPVTYQSRPVAYLLLGTSFLFVTSAQNGQTSAIGQQHVMSGQVSAAWNTFGSLPGIAALILGRFPQRPDGRPRCRARGAPAVSRRGNDHGAGGALRPVEARQLLR